MKRITGFVVGILCAIAFAAISQTTIAPGGAIFDQATGSWVGQINRLNGREERITATLGSGLTASKMLCLDSSNALTTTCSSATTTTGSIQVSSLFVSSGANASQLRTAQTTPPTCSSNCGTSPTVTGTDTAMLVTMGASGVPASGWVVTFNGTWSAAPTCTASMALGTMVIGKLPMVLVTAPTTVTVTTNGTAPSTSDKYFVQCIGVS